MARSVYRDVFSSYLLEVVMRRSHVNKHGSSKKFKKNVSRTKGANVHAPMRGGWRL